MYKKLGKTEEFYSLKPKANSRELSLVNAFYRARRQSPIDQKIPDSILNSVSYLADYPADVSCFVMQRLDDHLAKLRADKLKADHSNDR